mgnify:FL=1
MLEAGALAIEWLATGVFVAVLGALIKFAGWTWLLAGYNESTSSASDDVVQDVGGNAILRVGIALVVVGVVASVTSPPSFIGVVVGGVIVVEVARLIYRLNSISLSQTA